MSIWNEAVVLCHKTMDCPLPVRRVVLPQALEQNMECKIDRQFGCGISLWLLYLGHKGADVVGEAFDLPVVLSSNPHLWSRALGIVQKNEIMDTRCQNEPPP